MSLAMPRSWVWFSGNAWTAKNFILWMQCKSVWMKASAKCMNVNAESFNRKLHLWEVLGINRLNSEEKCTNWEVCLCVGCMIFFMQHAAFYNSVHMKYTQGCKRVTFRRFHLEIGHSRESCRSVKNIIIGGGHRSISESSVSRHL